MPLYRKKVHGQKRLNFQRRTQTTYVTPKPPMLKKTACWRENRRL